MASNFFPAVTEAPAPSPALGGSADTTATPTKPPALCGFIDHTSSYTCKTGTCKFNTDYYAVVAAMADYMLRLPTKYFIIRDMARDTWTSTCGGTRPGKLVGTCSDPTAPFCGTARFENGYLRYFCTGQIEQTLTGFFTSAGDSNASITPLLTGRNGPANSTAQPTTTPTQPQTTTTETCSSAGSSASAGAIAGSVVGGAAFGAIATLLTLLLIWCVRRKKERAAAADAREKEAAAAAAAQQQQHPHYSVAPPTTGSFQSPISHSQSLSTPSLNQSSYASPQTPSYKNQNHSQGYFPPEVEAREVDLNPRSELPSVTHAA
ncbi:hypothetical protein B0T24DRAFT_681938 [Lasiosphaeria ovina]|uniref:Uncharacterized protein n=1 Tax=Lasiosphaeria ovina TaxID=92902 RepID=A0AAE0N1H4_9PEZI|nr:hypothetical protein B0T24DRAFT_681938 [Lasiosphaeria ovina]